MATKITLPFTDEFTSIDSELYEVYESGNTVVDATGGYLRIRDTVGGTQGVGMLELPWTAFADDYGVFNRVLRVQSRLEYSSGSSTYHYAQQVLGNGYVGSLTRYADGPVLDSLVRNRTVNLTTLIRREANAGVTGLPGTFQAVWNGSRKHIQYKSRWLEPGRLGYWYSWNDGTNWQLEMIQRPSWDLRPNDDHAQTRCIGLRGVSHSSFPTYEERFSWLKIDEITTDDDIEDEADSSKKSWYLSINGTSASILRVSEDGGQTFATMTGSKGNNTYSNQTRMISATGDMQVAQTRQNITGNGLWVQTRIDLTSWLAQTNWPYGMSPFAGDGNQNQSSRDRVGLLAFAYLNPSGSHYLEVKHNFQGGYGSFTTVASTIAPTSIGCLWVFAPDLIYVGGSGPSVWKWNGSSWSTVLSPGGGGVEFCAIHAFAEDRIIAAIYATADLYEWNGSSWTQRTLPGSEKVYDVWGCVDADGEERWYCACVIAASSTRIYRKKPSESAWSQYGLSGGAITLPGHVHPFGDGSLLLTTGNGQIYRMPNGSSGFAFIEQQSGYSTRGLHGTTNGGAADLLPPVLQNQNPAPDSDGDTSQFYLEVVDLQSGLNASSVDIYVTPDGGSETQVWDNGATQNGASGSASAVAGGFGYTLTLPVGLRADSTLLVRVRAWDNNDNLLDESYLLNEVSEIYVINKDPAASATDVAKDKEASFTISSTSQVLQAQLKIRVRGALVYDGALGSFADGWAASTIAANGTGFDVVLAPDLTYRWHNGEVITIGVEASTASNSVIETWSFTAERSFRFSIYPFLLRAVRERDDKDV